jgi:hypothetical protein
VQINVRYTPDLRRTVRLNLYLHRKLFWAFAIFGALLILLGVAVKFNVILIALGVVLIPELPVLLCLNVYRSRKILLSEAEMTFTSEGIERRTDTVTIQVTWDKLKRIHELNDMWVFVANRPIRFGVPKRALSEDQQAELAAFIAARAASRAPGR